VSDIDDFVRQVQAQILEEARAQYSETVIDHWMHPRNLGAMDRPDGHARITGPCGDTIEIFIRVTGQRVAAVSFQTDGCATSIAAASMATEMATGKTLAEARAISQDDILEALEGLPDESRHCALLAASTLRAAIDDHLSLRGASWKRLYRPGIP
jgi:nitrogen fixation NifU-like protein